MVNPKIESGRRCLTGWVGRELIETPEITLRHMLGTPTCRWAGNAKYAAATWRGDIAKRRQSIAAVIGEPRWEEPYLQTVAAEHGFAASLLSAYQHYELRFLQRLRGAFALAILDPMRAQAVLAIDRFGQFPLVYQDDGERLVFGSDAQSVRRHPRTSDQINPQALFDYVYFHMIPAPSCIYKGYAKLSAAHFACWREGRLEVAPYWLPEFTEQKSRATAAELLEVIQTAVERRIDGGHIGAFLSGGLDSSTIAGVLARLRQNPSPTFSIGFKSDGYDEMEYARTTARHFGNPAHEYYVTPEDIADAIPQIAATYDEPFGNSSVVPAYLCAKMAAAVGVNRLLAGDGGDELFAGNARYAKQLLFERYERVPSALRGWLIEPLARHLSDRPLLLAKARSYIQQAQVPLPERLQSYNFLHRIPPEQIFEPDFLSGIDREAPLRLQRQIYGRPEGVSALKRMLYLDWQQTLADNDLRKVRHACELAGVDVAFPMLDEDVVAHAAAVPSGQLLTAKELRLYYKQAMQGFLPDATLRKEKHGFGLPFGPWMREHRQLQELAEDSLSTLAQRGYFRSEFLTEAGRLHQERHAAYYGELIWILMMLECWLREHADAPEIREVLLLNTDLPR
ncbi:MAG TPA: asparagine synthase-related protein [Nitrococcus sp.]|nr:asparagine synthase-related protein [Nitrococcus sp.]